MKWRRKINVSHSEQDFRYKLIIIPRTCYSCDTVFWLEKTKVYWSPILHEFMRFTCPIDGNRIEI